MRKHLAAFRIFNYAQGCRKKLLSVDIPLGVPTPVARGVPPTSAIPSSMTFGAANP